MRIETTCILRARRAALMLPGRAVVRDAAVAVTGGRVVAAGSWREVKAAATFPVRDLGEVTVMSGLVNAHTHLELSHLGLSPQTGAGFMAWLRWLVPQLGQTPDPEALSRAAASMESGGAAGVADIATRHPELAAAALAETGMEHVVQFERFGFAGDALLPDISHERLALAGHALYSTSAESLRAAKAWGRTRGKVFSIHLAEHEGEVEFLATGRGEFAGFMRQRVVPPDWSAPGLSPVEEAKRIGLLDEWTLAVHAVHVSKTDIETLKRSGAAVCLCPRSNAVIGVGRAPARAYLDAGVPCCLGTDSLASVPDLNLFGELAALVEHTPLTLAEAARLASTTAASLYGFTGLGSLAPGAKARFAVLPEELEGALGEDGI
jgi:cytosine/adenosine deaminase-related metal-dependent hydrolase